MTHPLPSIKRIASLVVGSAQLIFWLLFQPTTWQRYLARIDATLPGDVALAELSPAQWQHPLLKRLVIQAFGILPLGVTLVVALCLLTSGHPLATVVFGSAVGLAATATGTLAGTWAIGFAPGLVSSVIGGTVVGILFGGWVDLATINRVSSTLGTSADLATIQTLIHPVALLGINIPNIAAGVSVSISQRSVRSVSQQIGGALAGILLSLSLLAVGTVFAVQWLQGKYPLVPGPTHLAMVGAVIGTLYGGALGWRTGRWPLAIATSMGVGTALGFAVSTGILANSNLASGIVIGAGNAALLTTLFAVPYVLTVQLAGIWMAALAGAISSGGVYVIVASTIGGYPLTVTLPVSAACIGLGMTVAQWRPLVVYPWQTAWNWLLYRLDRQRQTSNNWLRWHSAFWDELQYLPFVGLDRHIIAVAQRNGSDARVAINYLSTRHQRWAAQAAQIELDAQHLEACVTVDDIARAHQGMGLGELSGPASTVLRSFIRASTDTQAAIHQLSSYYQRLSLTAIAENLDGLSRDLTRSTDRYAVRFHPIAHRWRHIVALHNQALTTSTNDSATIVSPYVIGVPLTARQTVFVGRNAIARRLETVLSQQRRSPLLLYGQRRMGKTSLLKNLGRLLPHTIVPLFVDLQGTVSRTTTPASFLYNLAKAMVRSAQHQRHLQLPPVNRGEWTDDPFTHFDDWLDRVEVSLGDRTALLALDEFEVLATVLGQGKLIESDILGLIRHVVQHRDRFTVLLSGTHTLNHFQRWSNYLIDFQVIPISYLHESEARQLIERPVPDFDLRYLPDATHAIIELTHCHPFLLQLVCEELVAMKNEQPLSQRHLATVDDVTATIPMALTSGSFFFADIERNQIDDVSLAILRDIAAQPNGAMEPTALEMKYSIDAKTGIRQLRQRELIEYNNNHYVISIGLVTHWLNETASPSMCD